MFTVNYGGSNVSSVQDNKGNGNYTRIGTELANASDAFYMGAWVCEDCTGGAGHTATVNLNSSTVGAIYFIEITGGAASEIVDVFNSAVDGSSPYDAQVTPTAGNRLLLSFITGNGSSNPTTYNCTAQSFTSVDAETDGSNALSGQVSSRIVTANGSTSYGPACTASSGNRASVFTIALKEAAGSEPDTTPEAFSFTDQTDVELETTITSAAVAITGIDEAIECEATGGTIDLNGDDNFQTTQDVENGDEIRARHTSSDSYSTAVNTTVDCNGVSDVFTSTTEAEPDIVATKLIFGSQPGNIVVGQTFGAFTVRAVDDDNALDDDFEGDVTLTLETGDGTLAGTTTQSAVAGVATFDDISINTLNTDAVIRASTDGLTAADSDQLDVTAGGEGAAGVPSTSRLGGMLQ